MVLRVQGVRLRSRRCLGSIREIKLNEMLIEVCYLESRIFFFFFFNRRLGTGCAGAALNSLINAVLCMHSFFSISYLETLLDI